MIDNQLVAQLLYSHNLATQDQILACWPDISPEKDLGALLVDKGLLPKETYRQMLAYLRTQSPNSAQDENATSQAEKEEENWTAAPARPSGGPKPVERPTANLTGKAAPLVDKSLAAKPADKAPAHKPINKTEAGASSQAAQARNVPVRVPEKLARDVTWEELLAFARHHGAADLHLSVGQPILLRRFGALQPASAEEMDVATIEKWVEAAVDKEQLDAFKEKGDLEFIYASGVGRYRVTLMKQRLGWDLTARIVPDRIRDFEESGLPDSCSELTKWAQGLVLVTGPVGCGKSSTLATLVEMVNQSRHDHIITIEEPIELVYAPAHCRITQRQVGPHTLTRDAALRAALREDPDIIVISELRDLDTIRLAVSAAETGHLVFGTMNTTNASRTIYRLIDSFPPEEQGIIRSMISESLRGVISQQLLPLKDGSGMVPAFEVLLVTSAVANLIRKDEAHQLGTAMITGKSAGMVLLDDSLRALVERGLIDPMEAMARANTPKDFERYMGRAGR